MIGDGGLSEVGTLLTMLPAAEEDERLLLRRVVDSRGAKSPSCEPCDEEVGKEKPHLLAEPDRFLLPDRLDDPSLKAFSIDKLPPKEPSFGSCGTGAASASAVLADDVVSDAAGWILDLRKNEENVPLRGAASLGRSTDADRFLLA